MHLLLYCFVKGGDFENSYFHSCIMITDQKELLNECSPFFHDFMIFYGHKKTAIMKGLLFFFSWYFLFSFKVTLEHICFRSNIISYKNTDRVNNMNPKYYLRSTEMI